MSCPAGGAALFTCGLLTLTTPAWAAPTHIIDQFNTANVLFWPLLIGGALLMLLGGWMWTGAPKTKSKLVFRSTRRRVG